ncbi:ABC transporter ATP-binding protein [bacterium]|nr:ABC transporter ATP-binding protein [candidate division CSSED10-310 bacterium]
MLHLENLTKRFDKRTVVDRLDLHVSKGQLYGFLGPNGAGKTTTIKMMVGLLRPDAGRVTINGHDLQTEEMKAKQSFGFVPDQPFLYDRLTPREFLHFIGGLYRMDPEHCDRSIDDWLGGFDLTGWQNELIGSFSHGMRQKLTLAAAFLHDPPVLIIDEPMVGLDPRGAVQLKRILRDKCSAGLSAFISTHSLEIAEQLADKIGIIHEGRLIAEGSMAELRGMVRREFQHLEDIFLELTHSGDLNAVVASLKES